MKLIHKHLGPIEANPAEFVGKKVMVTRNNRPEVARLDLKGFVRGDNL